MSFTLQGCGGLVVSKAFETAGIGVDSYPIVLDDTITLEGENTPLSSIPSLRICVTKFEDNRGMSNEQQVGMRRKMFYEYSVGTMLFDSSTIIATNIESVSSLVTQSVSNELKRNKHDVVTDKQSCDYVISGTIKEYRLTAPPFGVMTKKCRGTISVDIAIQRKGDNKTIFSKNYEASYDSPDYVKGGVSAYMMSYALNGALLSLLRNIVHDAELINVLKAQN